MYILLRVHGEAGIHLAVACSACVMHGCNAALGYVVQKLTPQSVPYKVACATILSTRKCVISHIAVRVLKLVLINAHGGGGG